MRIGLREMKAFSKLLFSSVRDSTFFESCGVADLITTCCKEADTFLLFLVRLKLFLRNLPFIAHDSGRKKQESCRGVCKEWREKVILCLDLPMAQNLFQVYTKAHYLWPWWNVMQVFWWAWSRDVARSEAAGIYHPGTNLKGLLLFRIQGLSEWKDFDANLCLHSLFSLGCINGERGLRGLEPPWMARIIPPFHCSAWDCLGRSSTLGYSGI